jgi:hypothetical protein
MRKLLTKINFTKSYNKDMVLKILPEPKHNLNMLQKIIKQYIYQKI